MEDEVMPIKDELVVQGLLLDKDQLLIYKDEQGEYHVFSTEPYDKDRKYQVIKMTWEDLSS